MMLDFFESNKKSKRFMEQKDRLHPLIAKKFFFIQIDSSDFLLKLLIISQIYTNFQEKFIQLHFPKAWSLHLFYKMATANKIEDQTTLSFACDHLMVKTVSTEKFPLMCHLHTPVYLFENSHQNSFINWHFKVSSTTYFLKILLNLLTMTFITCA